jgi:hypothetical protein
MGAARLKNFPRRVCVIVSLVALPADVCYSSARRLCILKDVWVMIWKRLTREIRAIEYLKARHTH